MIGYENQYCLLIALGPYCNIIEITVSFAKIVTRVIRFYPVSFIQSIFRLKR